MRRRIGKPSRGGIVFLTLMVVLIVAGLIVPGGTGRTIEIVGWLLLAFMLLVEFGVGASPTGRSRREEEGEEDDPETEYFDPRWPGGRY